MGTNLYSRRKKEEGRRKKEEGKRSHCHSFIDSEYPNRREGCYHILG
ncbi:MAG: hypothetical protein ACBR21_21375 [Microcoleus sp.]